MDEFYKNISNGTFHLLFNEGNRRNGTKFFLDGGELLWLEVIVMV